MLKGHTKEGRFYPEKDIREMMLPNTALNLR